MNEAVARFIDGSTAVYVTVVTPAENMDPGACVENNWMTPPELSRTDGGSQETVMNFCPSRRGLWY